MGYLIESMLPEDWQAVKLIYLEGIATGMATFETTAPEWEKWDASHLPSCRLVARSITGVISGWAAISPVSSRCVYAGVGEVSIYVAAVARGQKVGQTLLRALIDVSEQAGLWTLQAGIMAENQASIRLHTGAGFRMVGTRKQIGKLNNTWRDTILMERRSQIVGID
jgi:phosphinothricin acetyltransferase